MAKRALLHKNKLGDFKEWLEQKGYVIISTSQNPYEVLRAKKDNDTVIIYCKDTAKEHLSVMDKDKSLVWSFVREWKNLRRSRTWMKL